MVKKTISEKKVKKTPVKASPKKDSKYYEATGRRKTAAARVRLFSNKKSEILINNKPYEEYFPTLELRDSVDSPLKEVDCFDNFKVTVIAKGGGKKGQSKAVSHGIARALVKFNPDLRQKLSRAGYLTRDPRMRERKKFGLKRARKAPQWSKR